MRFFDALPILRSLKGRRLNDYGGDLIAGLTLAAIAIPEQMATARLAGFAPEIGFLAFIAGSAAFALFGASRFISVGADSTIAPIFAGGLAAFVAVGSPAYASLAAALAILAGVMLILGGAFRLGWVANLLSVPVTTGFLAGIAIHILVLQLPTLLGVPGGGDSFFHRSTLLVANAAHANQYDVALGAGVFLITLVCEKANRRLPGALVGLTAATLAVIVFHLEAHNVAVLGAVSGKLPHFASPDVKIEDIVHLFALALLVCVVVMVQTAATTRAFVPEEDEPPTVDRDFIGVGVGSILAGFLGAFPVNASPPRTAVTLESGGRSQIAGLVAVAIVGGLTAFGPTLLAHVPTAALAGILLYVALRISRFSVMAKVYRRTIGEFSLIVATTLAIVVLPIEQGVTAGIFLSLLHGIWTITRTPMIELQKVSGTSIWWPPSGDAKSEKIPGVMVLGFQAPLSFLNAQDFRRDLLAALQHAPQPLQLVVLEASSIVEIDYSAAEVLAHMIGHCHANGLLFAIARLQSLRGQHALKRFGILDTLGRDRIFRSVQEAIDTLTQTPAG
jgi:MFS superfamily sulfate permease-like transporter